MVKAREHWKARSLSGTDPYLAGQSFDDGFVAAHVEAEEREREQVQRADLLLATNNRQAAQLEDLEERVLVLTEELTTARREFENAIEVNSALRSADPTRTLEHARKYARRGLGAVNAALAVSSTENEEEQK